VNSFVGRRKRTKSNANANYKDGSRTKKEGEKKKERKEKKEQEEKKKNRKFHCLPWGGERVGEILRAKF